MYFIRSFYKATPRDIAFPHGLRRVPGEVRELFSKVDLFLANLKLILLKFRPKLGSSGTTATTTRTDSDKLGHVDCRS